MKSSRFYIEDTEQIFGCWRCGEIMGDIHEAETSEGYICDSCGERAIVSFTNTLDVMNDLYLKGLLSPDNEELELDDFIEE